MDKTFFVIVCCFMFFIPLCSTAGDNPFISREPQKKDYRPPAYTSKFFTKLVVLQQRLNQELARLTKELKTSGQKKALIPLILISFIYGIIHAAGPGHGKTISFSYFLSRRAPVKKGIVLGNLISFLHAFSGVVIVLSIYFIFKTAYLSSFEATSQKIKVISYSLIVLIGMVLLIKSLIDLRKSRLKNENTDFAARPVDNKGIFPIAIAVGMIPCPGVVIIMLFTLSQHLLAIGLLLSFFMALGMAMTISAAGILSILAHEGVLKGFSGRHKARLFIQKGLTIFGSLLIILFGMALLIGA
jgi:ABC-type nickel/cobalt efflux system permease component RcnA